MGRLTLSLALLAASCDRPTELTDHAGYGGEGSTDGKRMVVGCIWYYATGGTEANTKNVLAFCDDGRVCVSDDTSPAAGDWKCVQLVPR